MGGRERSDAMDETRKKRQEEMQKKMQKVPKKILPPLPAKSIDKELKDIQKGNEDLEENVLKEMETDRKKRNPPKKDLPGL